MITIVTTIAFIAGLMIGLFIAGLIGYCKLHKQRIDLLNDLVDGIEWCHKDPFTIIWTGISNAFIKKRW